MNIKEIQKITNEINQSKENYSKTSVYEEVLYWAREDILNAAQNGKCQCKIFTDDGIAAIKVINQLEMEGYTVWLICGYGYNIVIDWGKK